MLSVPNAHAHSSVGGSVLNAAYDFPFKSKVHCAPAASHFFRNRQPEASRLAMHIYGDPPRVRRPRAPATASPGIDIGQGTVERDPERPRVDE